MGTAMDIKSAVKDFIVQDILLGVGGVDLSDNASFLAQDLLDSTGVLSLVQFLEDKFDIKVTPEETIPENLDSLTKIESYVKRKQS